MAKYIIASTRLNDDGSVHSVSHPIEVDSDTINAIKIFGKTYIQQKHGRWIEIDKYHLGTCSVCGDRWGSVNIMRFCPSCGADMRGGENG